MEIVEQHMLTMSFMKGEDEDEVKTFIELVEILNAYVTTAGFRKNLPLKNSHREFIKYLHKSMVKDESYSD